MMILISTSAAPFVLDRTDERWAKRDPKGFADSLTDSDLVALIRTCNTAYHNTGTSQVSDKVYDVLIDELRDRKPNHSLLKNVGAVPVSVGGRKKVKLPYPLFSLDKIKPSTPVFIQWAKTHKGPYIISDKEDGLSIEGVYDGGVPVAAYTRGNGIVGQDVTHLIPYLGIPMKIPYKGHFVVRMETAMTEADFKKHFSKEVSKTEGKKYENARNLVAGIVNTTNRKHAAIEHLNHYAYEIIEPRMRPSVALATLKKYKFNVVPYIMVEDLDESFLTKYLATRKKKSPIAIDGLVIEQDKKTTRPMNGNPDYAVAFKVTSEEDVVEAEVVRVIWTESKYGTLKPVVLIKPVRLAGVTVTKASGFNAFFIETGIRQHERKASVGKKKLPIGPGAIIKITRSGDVIPHIIEVVKPAKVPDMPAVPYKYDKTGVNIVLVEDSDLVRDKRITDFFVGLDIDFIKLGTVKKFTKAGLDSILKIIKAKPGDFMQIEGIQAKSANKMHQAIHDKISKPISLPVLMKASGNFGAGMGERRLIEILKAYPTVLEDYVSKGEDYVLDKVIEIPGFQQTTALVFVEGIPGYLKWFKRSGLKTASLEETKIKATGSSLKGQVVGFTGFRNPELAVKIQQNGGEVSEGVKKNTTILLVSNMSTVSAKAEKARTMGIILMSADDFIRKYKL